MLKIINKNLKQIFLFISIGALSAMVEVLSFKIFSLEQIFPYLFSKEISWHYPLSNFASSICGILFNYVLSIRIVFKQGKHSKNREFLYFILISLFSMITTWIIYAFLTTIITTYLCFIFCLSKEIICKIIAIALVSVLNYIVKKRFVFYD